MANVIELKHRDEVIELHPYRVLAMRRLEQVRYGAVFEAELCYEQPQIRDDVVEQRALSACLTDSGDSIPSFVLSELEELVLGSFATGKTIYLAIKSKPAFGGRYIVAAIPSIEAVFAKEPAVR
ncbi:MAG: hypothetical protein M0Q90_16345 [Bacteroidales bacterium]|nr:hypothetical protein [Bacteroidales bacterium]